MPFRHKTRPPTRTVVYAGRTLGTAPGSQLSAAGSWLGAGPDAWPSDAPAGAPGVVGGKQPPPAEVSALDRVILAAHHFFFPHTPSRGELATTLAHLLTSLTLADFGLSSDRAFEVHTFPNIGYLPVLHQSHFHVGMFLLRKGACLSLHDHPEMAVFSKVLFGELHVRLFRWEDEKSSSVRDSSTSTLMEDPLNPGGTVPVWSLIQEQDKIATADSPPILIFNKLHCLTAMTDVILVDFLGPPYSAEESRGCTYFREVKSEQAIVEEGASLTRTWVAERLDPDSIETISLDQRSLAAAS